ncbi:TolC family protein [Oribacterium sp. WCC10]|uniref:TolC family protein n=1 Tax=Oribacterium sp. WCC10 TaxID=1855343 RepID=UPI0008ED7044|nr:TolC family protein [Oribacterium sp. WCC10]SFG34850.1 Outer membrane efflux protein [Oribacterium sp. WCC10]
MILSEKKLAMVMVGVMIIESFAAVAAERATIDYAPRQTSYERERTAEEWARLRDNNLEWDEIRDLVHEYNPTVSAIWINYRDNNDTGTYDLDYDAVISNIESVYDNALGISDAGDASAELARKQSLASVDTVIQNSDRQIVTLGYKKTEVTTAEAIKQQIIGIYTSDLNAKLNELTIKQNQNLLEQTMRKKQVGSATELDVMTAEKALKDAEAALQTSVADHTKTKQTVLVNLGWTYNAEPVICDVPEVSNDMITMINLENDIAQAMEKSYTLKIDERKLSLAESDGTISSSSITLGTDKNQVKSDMTAKYNALITALNAYEKQQLNETNLQQTLDKTTRSYASGAASLRDLETAQYNYESAKINTELKKYAVQAAYFTYCSYRDGLAGSGSSS